MQFHEVPEPLRSRPDPAAMAGLLESWIGQVVALGTLMGVMLRLVH